MTAVQVKNMRQAGLHSDGAGLYLHVSPTITKSWIFRYTLDGKNRDMGLGPVHTVSLAEAREHARRSRQLLLEKRDPIAVRDAGRSLEREQRGNAITFETCAERYIKAQAAGWKSDKHALQWTSTLKAHVYPVCGSKQVAQLEQADVLRVLEPIWSRLPETASRVRGRMEKVLDWAKGMKLRTGDNPAAWKGNLDALLPARSKVQTVENHPALPYREIGAFLPPLREMDGLAARALELAILTATRTSEVLEARWAEFDLVDKLWTIPAERMKASKQHRVPLSDRAVEILQTLPRLDDEDASTFVFPGMREGKSLSNMAMLAVLKRLDRGDITVHGFRSTFRDWAGEQTAYPREVCEHALAHQLADKAEAAYQRGDLLRKRRGLMDDWARYCATVRPASADVVSIKKRTAAA